MRRILIAGGGDAGFYTAGHLEKGLRRDEAQVTFVHPLRGGSPWRVLTGADDAR